MKDHQKKTIYDKILEVVAAAALLWAFYPLFFYNNIDSNAVFPTHYNIAGEVDGWGDRSSLLIMPLITLVLYIGFSILQKYPKIYNYPCKVTEQNANYLYRMGVQLMRHVKVYITILFAYSSNDMYSGAISESNRPMLPILYIILMAGMFLPVIIYTVKMKRYK